MTHSHSPAHIGDVDWDALAEDTEREGELLLGFLTETARLVAELRGRDAPAVRRVIDIGSGPGVGTCELARLFPDSYVVAVDGASAMLERVASRADSHGLSDRISTHRAELPVGLEDLGPADVIWASMSLHHVGDVVDALRLLRGLLAPSGVLAIAEMAEPLRALPDEIDVGRPGFTARFDAAEAEWFTAMRAALPDSTPSDELEKMLRDAGFEVQDARVARIRIDPPLPHLARRVLSARMRRARHSLEDLLDRDDLQTLDVLGDPDHPRGVIQRDDVFVAASRLIVVAQDTRRAARTSR